MTEFGRCRSTPPGKKTLSSLDAPLGDQSGQEGVRDWPTYSDQAERAALPNAFAPESPMEREFASFPYEEARTRRAIFDVWKT